MRSTNLPVGRFIAGLVTILPLSGILANGTITETSLNELEAFLEPELFISLTSASLGAAAFLYFLSDRFGQERRNANDRNDAAGEQRARRNETNMLEAARYFTLAFIICVSGIVATFGLDQLFQAQFSIPNGIAVSPQGLLATMAGNIPATAEIAGGSIALASVVLLFARGALKLLGTFSAA